MTAEIRTSTPAPAETSVAVVIPTRNRAELAIESVRALLRQRNHALQIFVSDNSSSPQEVQRLERFCRRRLKSGVVYMRPPESLAMATHWDWAMEQALSRSEATHFTIHYDRMVWKPGEAAELLAVTARHPHSLITYARDQLIDHEQSVVVCQTPWTGRVYKIDTARTIEVVRRGSIPDAAHALPIFSNCLVPRRILEQIRDSFGSICDSTGPDACFLARFCALNENYLHFDRPAGILCATHRSNGLNYLKNKVEGDFKDFLNTSSNQPWLQAAPVPGASLGQNMLYHEYELVRATTAGAKLPPLDIEGCLRELADSLKWVQDAQKRIELHETLKQHGLDHDLAIVPIATFEPWQQRFSLPPILLRSLLTRHGTIPFVKWWFNDAWIRFKYTQSGVLFQADYLNVKPPHICGFMFRNTKKAKDYMFAYPRVADHDPLFLALSPVEA
jgi:hypothetical protein